MRSLNRTSLVAVVAFGTLLLLGAISTSNAQTARSHSSHPHSHPHSHKQTPHAHSRPHAPSTGDSYNNDADVPATTAPHVPRAHEAPVPPAASSSTDASDDASPVHPLIEEHFQGWMKRHSRTYQSKTEYHHRLKIFHENFALINKHNKEAEQGKHSFTLGMSRFADLTNHEYRNLLLKNRASSTAHVQQLQRISSSSHGMTLQGNKHEANKLIVSNIHDFSDGLPTKVDWNAAGYMSPVKDQGQCGSCWAFAATGSIEGAYALANNRKLVSLSEQNLVDCVSNGNFTCEEGGEVTTAFQWVLDHKGIEMEEAYPYCACSGHGRSCKADSSKSDSFIRISEFHAITSGNETELQIASAHNPGIGVGIDASSSQFQLYSGGVFDFPACNATDVDHAVLVVGYGTEDGKDYWLVKNSWGANWGDDGYIKMSRNKNNQCGIASFASYAVIHADTKVPSDGNDADDGDVDWADWVPS